MVLTETITWRPVAAELPDADASVLLSAGELGVFEGFLDGTDDAGALVWRDVTAMPVEGVTHWAEMPNGPVPVAAGAIADAARQGIEMLRDGSKVDLGGRWKLPT